MDALEPPPPTMMVRRAPLVSTHELRGFYRYKELFQLVPAGPKDPRPPHVIGPRGLTLELRLDRRLPPDREADIWAHDHRERERVMHLHEHVTRKGREPGRDEWLTADRVSRDMNRSTAIMTEICRLLSVFTNYWFEWPGRSVAHLWVIFRESGGHQIRLAQAWYPSFAQGPADAFIEPHGPAVPRVFGTEYYARHRGYYSDREPVIELPHDLDERIDTYLGLARDEKLAFARAAELLGVATDVWRTSRSMSLAAGVFSVEALIHAGEPEPARCSACMNVLSAKTCEKCGGPRYGLTRRFRDFIEKYAGAAEPDANDLYSARSGLAHQGILLRSDEFDTGFNTGGQDNQAELERGTTTLVRRILLAWLEERRVLSEVKRRTDAGGSLRSESEGLQ